MKKPTETPHTQKLEHDYPIHPLLHPEFPHLEPGSINPSILRGSVFRGWKNLCTFECFHQSWHSELGFWSWWSCWGGLHKITEKKNGSCFCPCFIRSKKWENWRLSPAKPLISATRDFFLRTHVGVGMARRGALGWNISKMWLECWEKICSKNYMSKVPFYTLNCICTTPPLFSEVTNLFSTSWPSHPVQRTI